jgi:transposase, IS30 family
MMSHLSLADRSEIENGLRHGDGFHAIAKRLHVARSTIVREVRKHALASDKGAKGRVMNRCINRSSCERHFVCSSCSRPLQNRKCRNCSRCNTICPDFSELVCDKLAVPPYVCNGCTREGICVLHKKFYHASEAQNSYEKLLVSAREGAAITDEERRNLVSLLAGGLKKGQSLHHIVATYPDVFNLSERTLYDYIHSGILSPLGILELPVAPKMKPRRKKGLIHRVNPKCKEGRTIGDYEKFIAEKPGCYAVEMDSVLGTRGGKVLLTLQFDQCATMLAFIRDANTSQSVIDVFNMLESTFGLETFQRLFPVILTDNGSEFSNPDALERSVDGEHKRTNIFYCDPYCSWQKPNVENNHLNLRKIFPKGESMDFATQEKVALALSHMNSMLRAGLGNAPAIKLFEQCYGIGILDKLGIHLVAPSEVRMIPELVRE